VQSLIPNTLRLFLKNRWCQQWQIRHGEGDSSIHHRGKHGDVAEGGRFLVERAQNW
ncbi:unnamed protein product, partial [Musa acuminata var. zebrina]